MDKLKKVFSPGHSKDDEIMYGSGADRTGTGTGTGTGHSAQSTQPLHSTPAAERDTGLKGQILNPGGDKYDETRYGSTATTEPTATSRAHNDGGLKSQILNPGGDKYDETRYGSAAPGTTSGRPGLTTDASMASIKSGVVGKGPNSGMADAVAADLGSSEPRTGTTAGHTLPDRTGNHNHLGRDAALAGAATQPHHATHPTAGMEPRSAGNAHLNRDPALEQGSSHLGRDAGLAGAGAAGLAGYEANKHHHPSSSTGTGALGSERNFDPLTQHEHSHQYIGDPCGAGEESSARGFPHFTHGPHTTDTANRLDPHVPGEFPAASGEDRHRSSLDRDAAGTGVLGLGAYEANKHRDHQGGALGDRSREGGVLGGVSHATGDSKVPRAVQEAAPRGLEEALPNRIHDTSAGGRDTQGTHYPTSSAEQSRDHHYGRDAALGAGAGAAGLGAYEADRHRDRQPGALGGVSHATGDSKVPQTIQEAAPRGLERALPNKIHDTSAGGRDTQGAGYPSSTEQPRDHHYGRDAALAGGAGAAGLGAYEAGRHHDQPTGTSTGSAQQPQSIGYPSSSSHPQGVPAGAGVTGSSMSRAGPTEEDPASATVGPHKSNILNVLDPRVLPQPEKQKDRTTAGPHRSDAVNTLDPRVDSDLSKQRPQDQHHYGRDAGLAAGAGAAGAAGYEAYEHRRGPTAEDPASATVGPHSSNVANVVDPRVQPEPSKMHDRTTAGPYQSNTLNRADPRVDSDLSNQQRDHHYGRDAALAGGAGAAGLGAYELGKDRDARPQQGYDGAYNNTGLTGNQTTAGPYSSNMANRADPRVDSDLSQQNRDHYYGRDAAIAGTGAAAAGGAAYGLDQHEQEKLEKERAKEAEKAEKAHQKELAKEEKKHEKELAKEEKKHEKEAEKEAKAAEKKHEKEVAAAEKKHQHDVEKAERKHEKELEKEEKEREKEEHKKKHGGLLGFLHRDKEDPDAHKGRDLETVDQERHLAHQRELEGAAAAGSIPAAGAAFEPSVAEQEGHGSGHHERNRLHKDPPPEIQRQIDEANAARRSHEGVGSGLAGEGVGTGEDRFVTDPHTGLKMNVGKYGTGEGGTDGERNIHGFHPHDNAQRQL